MLHLKLNKTWMGVVAAALPMLAGCGQLSNYKSRTAVLASISDAEWAAAAANPVMIYFGSNNSIYQFRTSEAPGVNGPRLRFEVGKPYVIRMINKAETGNYTAEHYLSDYVTNRGGASLNSSNTTATGAGVGGGTWADNGFWSSVVVSKTVSRRAEYRAPFILDLELNDPSDIDGRSPSGGSAVAGLTGINSTYVSQTATTDQNSSAEDTKADVYFVPVRTGSFTMFCSKVSGTHKDMRAYIDIVGEPDAQPDFELADDFNMVYAESLERNGSASTMWSSSGYRVGSLGLAASGSTVNVIPAASNEKVSATELMSQRNSIALTTNGGRSGYLYRLYKQDGDTSDYLIDSDLFRNVVFRKIHDIDVQFKPVYLDSVKLLAGRGSVCGGLPYDAATNTVANPATSNCKAYKASGAVGTFYNGVGNPGEKQVDLYMVPQADKLGSYDTSITTSSGATLNTTWTVTESAL